MSPDAESSMEDVPIMERDPLSEEIAKQLERGLPRWPGFGDKGWMEYATPVSASVKQGLRRVLTLFTGPNGGNRTYYQESQRYCVCSSCLDKNDSSTDLMSSGNRLGSAFDSVPEESAIPNLSSTAPVSFRLIEVRLPLPTTTHDTHRYLDSHS
jgi:chromatin structure-remodeling complex subunit RSC1/2